MKKDLLNKFVYQAGADVCGIASIDRFQNAPSGFHPADILPDARSVIVYGKQFMKGTFISKSTVPYTLTRNQLIQDVDNISVKLSGFIEKDGHIAVPVPSTDPYEYWDEERRHGRGILSLKHSAQLAGVGVIGKNTLLINKEYGNRLWLGAVITNMEMEPDEIRKSVCPEKCRICLDACPQSALDGITIDQKKCREICFSCTEGGGWVIKCNKCRMECPFAKI